MAECYPKEDPTAVFTKISKYGILLKHDFERLYEAGSAIIDYDQRKINKSNFGLLDTYLSKLTSVVR